MDSIKDTGADKEVKQCNCLGPQVVGGKLQPHCPCAMTTLNHMDLDVELSEGGEPAPIKIRAGYDLKREFPAYILPARPIQKWQGRGKRKMPMRR